MFKIKWASFGINNGLMQRINQNDFILKSPTFVKVFVTQNNDKCLSKIESSIASAYLGNFVVVTSVFASLEEWYTSTSDPLTRTAICTYNHRRSATIDR